MEILLNKGETTVYIQGSDIEFEVATEGIIVGACHTLIVESRYVGPGRVSLKVFPRTGKPTKITNNVQVAVVVPAAIVLADEEEVSSPAVEDEEADLLDDSSFPGDSDIVDASAPAAVKTRIVKRPGRPKGIRK